MLISESEIAVNLGGTAKQSPSVPDELTAVSLLRRKGGLFCKGGCPMEQQLGMTDETTMPAGEYITGSEVLLRGLLQEGDVYSHEWPFQPNR